MSMEKLLTIKEVAGILGLSEEEVKELSEKGKIPAYKIAGAHLRFKQEQIDEIAKDRLRQYPAERQKILGEARTGLVERLKDFFYFNDFYIISIIIILIILFIILRT